MKPSTRQFIISGIIGLICSFTGLFFWGMSLGYTSSHPGKENKFTPIGIILTISGILIIAYSAVSYRKRIKGF